MRLAAIGECMLEAATGQSFFSNAMAFGFGGDTLNTAIYMARALARDHRPSVSYVTALGDDLCSDALVDAWRAEGIDDKLIFRLPGQLPGFYLIHNNNQGERQFFYWREQAAARSLLNDGRDQLIIKELSGYDLVYLSGITLAILAQIDCTAVTKLLFELAAQGNRIAFDPNFRPVLWTDTDAARKAYQEISPALEFCLPTFDDEHDLFGDPDPTATASRWQSWGVSEVVVKQGGDAALIATSTESLSSAPARVKHVVDTTAAGDAFNGTYLVRRLLGDKPIAAADKSHTVAAQVIQHKGAIVPRLRL